MEDNIRDAVFTALFQSIIYEDKERRSVIDDKTYVKFIDNNEFGDVDFNRMGIRVNRIDFSDNSIHGKDYEFGQYVRVGLGQLLLFGGRDFVYDMVDDILYDFYGIERPSMEEEIVSLPF